MSLSESSSSGPAPTCHTRKAKRTQQSRDNTPLLEPESPIKRHKSAEGHQQQAHWGLPSSLASSALLSFQRAASSRVSKLAEAGCTSNEILTSCLLATRRTAPTKVSKFDWTFSSNSFPHLSSTTLGAAYVVRNELSSLLQEGYNLTEAVKLLAFRLGQEIEPSELSLDAPLLQLVDIDPPNPLPSYYQRHADTSAVEQHQPPFNSFNNIAPVPTTDDSHLTQHQLDYPTTPVMEDIILETEHTMLVSRLEEETSPARPKRPNQDMKRLGFDLHTILMPGAKRSRLTEH